MELCDKPLEDHIPVKPRQHRVEISDRDTDPQSAIPLSNTVYVESQEKYAMGFHYIRF
jgi:hypothetical protein